LGASLQARAHCFVILQQCRQVKKCSHIKDHSKDILTVTLIVPGNKEWIAVSVECLFVKLILAQIGLNLLKANFYEHQIESRKNCRAVK
jgi:hypothetical protein